MLFGQMKSEHTGFLKGETHRTREQGLKGFLWCKWCPEPRKRGCYRSLNNSCKQFFLHHRFLENNKAKAPDRMKELMLGENVHLPVHPKGAETRLLCRTLEFILSKLGKSCLHEWQRHCLVSWSRFGPLGSSEGKSICSNVQNQLSTFARVQLWGTSLGRMVRCPCGCGAIVDLVGMVL